MPATEGRLKLPRPLSSEAPAGPQAFLELTQRLTRWEKGGTAAERDAFYGVPTTSAERLALQGASWTRSDVSRREAYFAERSASNPAGAQFAGWYAVSSGVGTPLGSWDAPTRYSGNFNFNGEGGGGTRAGLLEFTIPDPGVPFQAQIIGHFAGGGNDSSTRVDFDAGYGGTGNAPLVGFLAPDYGVENPGRRQGLLVSPLSEVLTGVQRWRLVATRRSGSADGSIDLTPFRFQVTYTQAL